MPEIISAQVYLGDDICVLPGSEIFFRDPKTRTILVWGHLIDLVTLNGTSHKVFIELPQGVANYKADQQEIIERVAIDQYQYVFVNGDLSNAQSAVFAVKSSTEPLTVVRDDDITFIVKSTTKDSYVEIAVELRY